MISAGAIDRPRHARHIPLGGNDSAPQAVQRSTTSRPSPAAAQNGAVSSVTAGGMPTTGRLAGLGQRTLAIR